MSRLTNPFRFLVVPIDDQVHMDHTIGPYTFENKNQLVGDYLEILKNEKKRKITYRNNDYLLYSIETILSRFHLLKLAKEKPLDIHVPGDEDVEDIRTLDYPYVYVIIDIEHQIILIEYISTVFGNTETTSNILSAFLNEYANTFNYDVALNPMLIKDKFWDTIRSYGRITEVEFSLESPNLFDGILDIEELLKKIRIKYNNTKSNFRFINDNGTLRLEKQNEELNNVIEYIVNGGGKWTLTVLEGGKKEKKESIDHIQKIVVNEELEEEFTSKPERIQSYLSSVEDVLKK